MNRIHACEPGNNEIGRDVQGHASRCVKRNVWGQAINMESKENGPKHAMRWRE